MGYGVSRFGDADLRSREWQGTAKPEKNLYADHDIVEQVQRQEEALAQDPHRYLSDSPTMLEQDAHVRGRPSHHDNHDFKLFSDRTGGIEAAWQ